MKLTDELDALLRRFNVVPIRWMYSSGDCMSECMPSERPSALCYMDNACNAIYHQRQVINSLREDERRMDWIIDNCTTYGGGHGFELRVFVPVDSECIRGAIDAAIAAKEQA